MISDTQIQGERNTTGKWIVVPDRLLTFGVKLAVEAEIVELPPVDDMVFITVVVVVMVETSIVESTSSEFSSRTSIFLLRSCESDRLESVYISDLIRLKSSRVLERRIKE